MNYAEALQDATAVIAEAGQLALLRRSAASSYDPAAGTSDVAYLDLDVKVVVTNFRSAEIDGEKVRRGDKRVLMVEQPQVDDLVVIGSEAHKVLGVETVAPGGLAVLYKAQVRK